METHTLATLRFLAARNLGEIAAARSDSEQALLLMLEACGEDATDGTLWRRAGRLAEETRQPHVARHCFENALLCAPDSWLALEGVCRACAAAGDVAGASRALESLRAMDPKHPAPVDIDALDRDEPLGALPEPPTKRARTHKEAKAPPQRDNVPVVAIAVGGATWAALARAMLRQLKLPARVADPAAVVAPRIVEPAVDKCGDGSGAAGGEADGSGIHGNAPDEGEADGGVEAADVDMTAAGASPSKQALAASRGSSGAGEEQQERGAEPTEEAPPAEPSSPEGTAERGDQQQTNEEADAKKGKGKGKGKAPPARASARVRDLTEEVERAKASEVARSKENAKDTLDSFLPVLSTTHAPGAAVAVDVDGEADDVAQADAPAVSAFVNVLVGARCCAAAAAARVLRGALANGAAHVPSSARTLGELALVLATAGGAAAAGFEWSSEELIALGECHLAAAAGIKEDGELRADDEEDEPGEDEEESQERAAAHLGRASAAVAAAIAAMLTTHEAPQGDAGGEETLPVSIFGVPATHSAAAALHWLCGRVAMHEHQAASGVLHLKQCAKLLLGDEGDLPLQGEQATAAGSGPRPEVVRQYLSKLEIRQVLDNADEMQQRGQERKMLEDLGPFLKAEGTSSRLFANVFSTDEEMQLLWIAVKAFDSLSSRFMAAPAAGSAAAESVDLGVDNLFGDRSLHLELATLDGLLTRVSREARQKAKRKSVNLAHPNAPSIGEVLRAVSESAKRAVALLADDGGELAKARVAAVPLAVVHTLMVRVMEAINARMAEAGGVKAKGVAIATKGKLRALNLGTSDTALSDASLAYVSLVTLASAIEGDSLISAASRERRVLLLLQSMLGPGALRARNAAFLRHMCRRLVQRKSAVSKQREALAKAGNSARAQGAQAGEAQVGSAESLAAEEKQLDSALGKCLKPLYGVTLVSRTAADLDKETLITDGMRMEDIKLESPQDAADLYQHFVLPLVKGAPVKRWNRLAIVMQAVRKHFSALPPETADMLAELRALLDLPSIDEAKLSGGALPALVQPPIEAGEGSSVTEPRLPPSWDAPGVRDARARDPNALTHATLHYYCAFSDDNVQDSERCALMWDKDDAEFVRPIVTYLMSDLVYNTDRIESWMALGKLYDDALDIILNDACKVMDAARWRRDGADGSNPHGYALNARIAKFRRRTRRALLHALALIRKRGSTAQGLDVATAAEMLGLSSYDLLQRAPPMCDMLSALPGKGDPAFTQAARFALDAFELAIANPPKDDGERAAPSLVARAGPNTGWLWHLYAGKLHAKLGEHTQSLDALARAAKQAPGLVEPFYTIHAYRLKILERAALAGDAKALEAAAAAAAKYCCEDYSAVAGSVAALAQRMHADGVAAMRKVWLFSKWFHKASYRLAVAAVSPLSVDASDDAAVSAAIVAGMEELKPNFVVRERTGMNLWEIEAGTISDAGGGRKRKLEARIEVARLSQSQADGAAASAEGGDSLPPWSAAHPLLLVERGESSRKFIACVRKYVLFFVRLLAERGAEGDLAALQIAEKLISVIPESNFKEPLKDMTTVLRGAYSASLARAATATDGQARAKVDVLCFDLLSSYLKGEGGTETLAADVAASRRLFEMTSFGVLAGRAAAWEAVLPPAGARPSNATLAPEVALKADAMNIDTAAGAVTAPPLQQPGAATIGQAPVGKDATTEPDGIADAEPGSGVEAALLQATQRYLCEAPPSGDGQDTGSADARTTMLRRLEKVERAMRDVSSRYPSPRLRPRPVRALMRTLGETVVATLPQLLAVSVKALREQGSYPERESALTDIEVVLQAMAAAYHIQERLDAQHEQRGDGKRDQLTALVLEGACFIEPGCSFAGAIKLAERAAKHAGVSNLLKSIKSRVAKEQRLAAAKEALRLLAQREEATKQKGEEPKAADARASGALEDAAPVAAGEAASPARAGGEDVAAMEDG